MTRMFRLLPLIMPVFAAGCWDAPAPPASDQQDQTSAAPSLPPAIDPAPADENAVADNGATARLTALAPASRSGASARPGQPSAAPASLDLPASDDAGSAIPFPQEVTAFMVDRDGCDHFRGEEPYDEERRVYLAESIAELCTGSDARLASLRKRYVADPSVIAALSGYEDRIEGVTRAERPTARDGREDPPLFDF